MTKVILATKAPYLKLRTKKSSNAGDNAMYYGIIAHDNKAGHQFRVNYKSLQEMAAHVAKVAPPKKETSGATFINMMDAYYDDYNQ